MQTETKTLTLWKNDPFLYFLKDKLRFSSLRVALTLTAIAALAIFGLGWIADSSYTGRGVRFIDPQFYSQMLAFFVFGYLILGGFYAWHSEAIAYMLTSLEQTGVIRAVSEQGSQHVKSFPDFITQFQMAVDSKKWAIGALVFAVGFCIFEGLVALPVSFSITGRSTFWYDVKWFLAVVLVVFCVWVYALCMIGVKQLVTVVYLNRLFQWFDIHIRPMHSDEAGGLGALGNFTLKTSLLVIGMGAVAAVFTAIDWVNRFNPLTRSDILIFWASYILSTPINLIVPMLAAHGAMQKTRNEKLNEIAREFEKTLSDAGVTKTGDAGAIKKANEKLKELQTRYEIVAESFPTWPVPERLFRNFSITASVPLLSGLVSTVINFVAKK